MVTQKILKKYGCTTERLKKIFTNEDAASTDGKLRKKWELILSSRVQNGIFDSLQKAPIYQAVDLAWDSQPILKQTVPLMLYAQGLLKESSCIKQLDALDCSSEFCHKDKDGDIKVNAVRLYEVSVNLVRTYITRRVAAQASRFGNLWPYYKYEPRGVSSVDKLRSEALSMRTDIMADQFGYRHFNTQQIRRAFNYGFTVNFPLEGWTKEKQRMPTSYAEEFSTGEGDDEEKVVREGIDFIAPHPTRLFWDQSAPLSQVNSDNGPMWLGFWDVVTYSQIRDNDEYWNKDKVWYTDQMIEYWSQFDSYFSYYFPDTAMAVPNKPSMAFDNDRKMAVGRYASDEGDKAAYFMNYYMKINPKKEGWAEYDYDVWVKLMLAGDSTVIGGEFLSTIPAAYGGINQNDDRQTSIAPAHEILPYQDQITNIMSQLLLNMKAACVQIWMVDQDALPPEVRAYIKESIEAGEVYVNPKAIFFSGQAYEELGVKTNPSDVIQVIQIDIAQKVSEAFGAIAQLLGIAERLLILSPQEIGQPSPRETTATEVASLATTTESVYTFYGDGIDELREGQKRIIFDSLIAYTDEDSDIEVPVIHRFTEETIKEAGFESAETDTDGTTTRIIGKPKTLIHDVLWSSRDGSERSSNVEAGKIIMGILQSLSGDEEIRAAIGKKRLFGMINEAVRLSGAGLDMKLEVADGESDEFTSMTQQKLQEIGNILTQLAQKVMEHDQALAQISQALGIPPSPQGGGQPAAPSPDFAPTPPGAQPPQPAPQPAQTPIQ